MPLDDSLVETPEFGNKGLLKTVKMKEKPGDKDDPTQEREKDLWFNDSVFEEAEKSSTGANRRQRINKETNDREYLMERYGKASRSIFEGSLATPSFMRGENVEATILGFGPLGASVVIHKKEGGDRGDRKERSDEEAEGRGLILQQEVTFWSALNDGQPDIGETLNAYILNVREDGKLDVTLRPVGYDKVLVARDRILAAARDGAATVDGQEQAGCLEVGPKSTPDEIWRQLPGMSKGEFKTAAGKLINEGAVVLEAQGRALRFVPEDERVQAPKQPFSGKSPRGWRAPDGCTIFAANIPFSMTNMELAEVVETKIGFGHIAAIKMGVDPATGKSRGFGHIEFFSEDQTDMAIQKLVGMRVNGRELRFETPYRDAGRSEGSDGRKPPRDWGASSQFGRRDSSGRSLRKTESGRGERRSDSWVTVYAGNLAYSVTEESLRYTIEDALGEGFENVVASVRIAVDRDEPTRKRGFGYVDFFDEKTAKKACEALAGMQVMGRPLKLDYEGPKRRPKEEGAGGRDRESRVHYKSRPSWKTRSDRGSRPRRD
jgi:RNA recognition motif-containing protein